MDNNENRKKSFMTKAEGFLAGKGFYIVLLGCVAVIGISAWVLLGPDDGASSGSGQDGYVWEPEDTGSISDAGSSLTGDMGELWTDDGPGSEILTGGGAPDDSVETLAPSDIPNKPDLPDVPDVPETPNAGGEASQPEPEKHWTETITVGDIAMLRPVTGDVSADYSVDALVYSKTMADWRTHSGLDIAAQLGTKVMAAADGLVEDVFKDDMFGTTVVIYHGAGVRTVYSNLAETPTVTAGDEVTAGATIGSVGDTAIAEIGEVAHLHFEVTVDGKSSDPTSWLS